MSRIHSLYARARCSHLFALSLLAITTSHCSLVIGDVPPKAEDAGSADGAALEDEDAASADPTELADAQTYVEDSAADLDAGGAGESNDAGQRDGNVADAADESCDSGVAWYADEDGDGFGTGEALVACPKPSGKWARQAGDCQDADNRVFPRQPLYFGAPYRARDGNDSYDYDCSGLEDGNPQQPSLGAGCGLLELTACQGSGYARTQRTGLLVNSVCGSLVIDTCEAKVLVLLCGSTSQTTTDPYLCH